ncbi:MAG: hypothetical protein KDJ52_32645, partial [Anaerolineae bacterium]|nr:hypothetical protein [Anaerolineae bacterium]
PPMHLGIRGIVQSVPFYGWLLLLAVGTGTIIWLWHVGVGRFLYNTAIRVQTDFKQWQEPFFLWTVVFIYAFGYAAVIFLLSNRSLFPAYDWPRYLTPTYPLILILWSTGWVALFKVISYGWPNWSRSLAVALPTLLWLLPYGNQTVGFIQQAAKGQEYTSVEWQQSQVIHELAAIISPDDRIYSDSPGVLSFRLAHPARYLPHTEAREEFVDLIYQTNQLKGNQYVIIFTGPLENTDPYFNTRLTGVDIAIIAANRSDIQIVGEFEDGVIYQLGHPSGATMSSPENNRTF